MPEQHSRDDTRVDGPNRGAPVEVVVVHRDAPAECARTVEAFLGQAVRVHVTVVDNGSPAPALAALERLPSSVDVLALGANRGFGPAANAGIERWLEAGSGDWVAIAPHDAVPEPDCLSRILAGVDGQPRAGLVSAEFGPGYDSKPVVDRYLGGYVEESPGTEGWGDAPYPHGTLFLARREALEDIGLFDERYFAYCEEADLGVRASRAGWAVGVMWGAVVANPVQPEGRVTSYLQLRNTLLFVRDHFGAYPAFIRCCIAVVGMGIARLRPEGPRHRHQREEWQAIVDFVAGRFGPPPQWVLDTERRGH